MAEHYYLLTRSHIRYWGVVVDCKSKQRLQSKGNGITSKAVERRWYPLTNNTAGLITNWLWTLVPHSMGLLFGFLPKIVHGVVVHPQGASPLNRERAWSTPTCLPGSVEQSVISYIHLEALQSLLLVIYFLLKVLMGLAAHESTCLLLFILVAMRCIWIGTWEWQENLVTMHHHFRLQFSLSHLTYKVMRCMLGVLNHVK